MDLPKRSTQTDEQTNNPLYSIMSSYELFLIHLFSENFSLISWCQLNCYLYPGGAAGGGWRGIRRPRSTTHTGRGVIQRERGSEKLTMAS